MSAHNFTLTFSLPAGMEDTEQLIERLGKEGCTDALIGLGRTGCVGLYFTREARSAHEAVRSAVADVKRAIPDARLVEVAMHKSDNSDLTFEA